MIDFFSSVDSTPTSSSRGRSQTFNVGLLLAKDHGLCLSSPVQKRHRHTVTSPVRDYEGNYRAQAHGVWEESEKIDLFSLKKSKLRKDLFAVSMYLVEQTGNRLKHF